jgi:hypothetical protein
MLPPRFRPILAPFAQVSCFGDEAQAVDFKGKTGEPGRDRTFDQLVKSQLSVYMAQSLTVGG